VDVRPLVPTPRGTITLDGPDAKGRHYVSAASGLATSGGSAWAVSDELGELVHVTHPSSADDLRGHLVPGLPAQQKKHDLESVITLPGALVGMDGTALLAVGSGSSPDRHRAALQQLDAAGAPIGAARAIDLTEIYHAIDERLPLQPNIEGALVRHGAGGPELLLLHRGKAAGDRNVIFVLDGAQALGSAARTGSIPAASLRSAHEIDLGTIGGERLGFSDARALPDGRIAFTASGEGGDGSGDGAIRGSAFGIMDANFGVTALRPLAGPPRKVEGLAPTAELDPTASPTSWTLVTDPDDPERGTELLGVDLG